MTDNRTNEPNQNETKSGQTFCFTEAQVEAAAKALDPKAFEEGAAEYRAWKSNMDFQVAVAAHKKRLRTRRYHASKDARAALVAAQGAAPQAESANNVKCRCAHGAGEHDFSDPRERCRMIGCHCQGWFGVSPAQPSSTVDEDALAGVINAALDKWEGDEPSEVFVARAVAEWLKEQGQ